MAVLDCIRRRTTNAREINSCLIIPNQEDLDRIIERDRVDHTKKMSCDPSLLAAPDDPEPDANKRDSDARWNGARQRNTFAACIYCSNS